MMQNPVLVMSLSGTVSFLLYFLFYPIIKRYCHPQVRYNFLKISMVFYLIPFPYYKFKILEILVQCFPILNGFFKAKTGIIYSKDIAFVEEDQTIVYSFFTKTIYAIVICCGIISVIILISQCYRYMRAKKFYMSHATVINSSSFDKERKQIGIKRRVIFVSSKYFDTPFTIGVLKPVIVIPEYNKMSDEWKKSYCSYVMKHELTHIKNNDSLFKFLMIVVMAIHWFNPICYLIYHEIKVMCEICCDADIISGLSPKEQKNYFMFLINLSSIRPIDKEQKFAINLMNYTYQITKRRIQEMSCLNKKKKRGIAIIAVVIMCSLSSTVCFAYAPPVEIAEDYNEDMNFVIMTPEGVAPYGIGKEYLPYESFITDSEGNIYQYKEEAGEKSTCKHKTYSVVAFTTHIKSSKGGCTISYYSGKQCDFCTKLIDKTLTNKVSYDICVH